jgi:hypothetical protein
MPDAPDRQELLTALTTEHFALQGARSQAASESSSRAALYVSAVSSTLVALGFIGQISAVGNVFTLFALTALPTLYFLGLVTFIRLVESGVEDILYGRAINRIRHYYLELAGSKAPLFMLSAHDDVPGVLANMGVPPRRSQLYFTASSMVAVINSVIAGSTVAIAIGAAGNQPLGLAAGIGGLAAIVSLLILFRVQASRFNAGADIEPMFPTAAQAGRPGEGGANGAPG